MFDAGKTIGEGLFNSSSAVRFAATGALPIYYMACNEHSTHLNEFLSFLVQLRKWNTAQRRSLDMCGRAMLS
jgi:hypothetical protein